MKRLCPGLFTLLLIVSPLSLSAVELPTAPSNAKEPWTKEELKVFMKQMAEYVVKYHMRTDDCPMRGKIYEFYYPADDQPGYGRGWDTMHDGGFFGNACVLAYRATGDEYYLNLLQEYIMPFYLKILNHSDTLFPNRERAFTDGKVLPEDKWVVDKGFIPYGWDDGTGVHFSFYARGLSLKKHYPKQFGFTWFAEPTKPGEVNGYSHGTSNHMALNIFPMLANYWLLTRDPECASALKHLDESRVRWTGNSPPFCQIGDAAANGDAEKAHALAGHYDRASWPPATPLYAALVEKRRSVLPSFLDRFQGEYTACVIANRVGPGVTKQITQNVYDCLRLADMWFGDNPRPRGLQVADCNVGDIHVWIIEGEFSQHAGDVPETMVGSRMGPQTMLMSALCLQMMDAFPDAWSDYYAEARQRGDVELGVWNEPPADEVKKVLTAELTEGLRYWQAEWNEHGRIRPDWPLGGSDLKPRPGYLGPELSETGGYAHLIAAASEYLLLMDGRRDWEVAWQVRAEP